MKKTQKESLKKSLQYEIDKAKAAMLMVDKLPINLICQAFPDGRWSQTFASEFCFTLPFSFALIEETKRFMKDQYPGYKLIRENQYVWDTSAEAGHFVEYATQEENWEDRTRFEFAFRTGREGTTCVLNKIGEKSVPVFEVVCAAGAEEMK